MGASVRPTTPPRPGSGALQGSVRTQKTPPERGFQMERLMGLEPTTFCMASRRSSPLSYSRRGAASIARVLAGGVERLVDEAVGQLVVLAPHVAVGHGADAAREAL